MSARFIAAHVPCFKDEEALDELMRVGLRFSPGARVHPADGLVVEISGMERLYGGRFMRLPFVLQAEIKKRLGLRQVSMGSGATAFTAMLCARAAPPGGMLLCEKGEEERTIAPLPVNALPGLSQRSLQALARYNLKRLGDLQGLPAHFLERRLGQEGKRIYWMAQGLDLAEGHDAEPARAGPIRADKTFKRDTNDLGTVRNAMRLLSDRIAFRLREEKQLAGRLTLFVIYSDRKRCRRSVSLSVPVSDFESILGHAQRLLDGLYARRVSLRGLCLSAERLTGETRQTALFVPAGEEKRRRMGETLDAIRRRMGFSVILNANLMEAAREEKGSA